MSSAFSITCPKCGHTASVPSKAAGQTVKCPKCGESFTAVQTFSLEVPQPVAIPASGRGGGQTDPGQPATYYKSGAVQVTDVGVYFHGTMYPIRTIAGVEVRQHQVEGTAEVDRARIAAPVIIGVLVGIVLYAVVQFLSEPVAIFMVIVSFTAGLSWALYMYFSKSPPWFTQYSVSVRGGDGVGHSYRHDDREVIQAIATAIEQAMVMVKG